jgi:hypothetical protein
VGVQYVFREPGEVPSDEVNAHLRNPGQGIEGLRLSEVTMASRIGRRTRLLFLGFGIAIVALGHGVGHAQRAPGMGTVRVSPSTLFKGDLKRLEPHLGLTTGCVEVRHKGPRRHLRLETRLEVWKDGKLDGPIIERGTLYPDDLEVSVSVKEAHDAEGKARLRVIVARTDAAASTSWIDRPEEKKGELGATFSSTEAIRKPIELEEGKPAAVWITRKNTSGEFFPDLTLEEKAGRSTWALLLKLTVQIEQDEGNRAAPGVAKPD